MATNEEILQAYKFLKNHPEALVIRAARLRFTNYARYVNLRLDLQPFHEVFYKILDRFAHGLIKKLIITMPPQHGKSEGSSRLLPSYMLGLNPDLKIAIGSYAATIAQDFNRDVQRIIDTVEYRKVFPDTFLNTSNVVTMANTYLRNSNVIEMVDHRGSLRVVGRGGSLTSKTVDVMILDDVYKDAAEGNSPVVREAAWKWYTGVVRKRLHNDSQELIVFTRWHEDDLIGRIGKLEQVIDVTQWKDLDNIPNGAWVAINFQAIKEDEPTELDPRSKHTALWEGRHSLAKLEAERKLDPVMFQCLNQGNPSSAEGRLYQPFKTWSDPKDWGTLVGRGNYTDCADEGTDYLCSICYDKYLSPYTEYDEQTKRHKPVYYLLVTDIVYTDQPIEYTTVAVPDMLNRMGTQYAHIESNNGGRAFATIITPKTSCKINWFYQNKNKEARIITNAGSVTKYIIMPYDWMTRFPIFYEHVTSFLREFSANAHDDAPDDLTGIIEKEINVVTTKSRGVIIRN